MTETESVQIARIDERQQTIIERIEKLENVVEDAVDKSRSMQVRIIWAVLILALSQLTSTIGMDKLERIIGLLK